MTSTSEKTESEQLERVTHETLVEALAAAQGEFPTIAKSKTARVQGREGKAGYEYTYADIGDVLGAVRPVLSRHGLAIVQRTLIGEGGKTRLLTELRFGDEILESEIEIGQSSGSPQQFGGALTYLRRYEAVTLLGIAAEEDTDAQHVDPVRNGNGDVPQLPTWAKPATSRRMKEFGDALVPIMGKVRARRVAASVRATLGECPDLVVATAKLIGADVAEAITAAGPDGALVEFGARLEQLDADAVAAAEAAQAQADAEKPDETPAEPSEPAEDVDEPPSEVVDAEPVDDGKPAAGTVEVDLAGVKDVEEATERLRDEGCICASPCAPKEDVGAHDDACPIKGHGIPF